MTDAIVRVATALVSGAVLLGAVAGAHAQWKPERSVELIVSAAPGGNQDLTARAIHVIWQERKIVSPAVVMSKPGGGGGVAAHYLSQHAGDPHYLLMLAPTTLTSRIMGTGKMDHNDFTPLALLFNEYIFVSVKADSPIKSGRDLIQRLKEAPDSLSVAVATAIGNHIHMGIALPMKAAGVDLRRMKVVPFKSSGQSLTALAGGHVDVVASTVAALLPHVAAGRVRIIGMSAPQRMTGALANVPTWKEQGANAEFDSWRGLAGAKGISGAQIEFWEKTIAATTQTAEWKKDVENNYRVANFLGSRDTQRYWDAQYKELREALTEMGLAKTGG